VNHVAEEPRVFASRASETLVTMRTRVAQAGDRIPLVLVASIALTAVVVLLLVVAQISFQVQDALGNKTYSLANFRVLYTDSFAARALTNTAIFAAVSMFVTFGFAIPIAWLAERTTLPGRTWSSRC
jgi:ABC-type Fe3+ transport system permease subunit